MKTFIAILLCFFTTLPVAHAQRFPKIAGNTNDLMAQPVPDIHSLTIVKGWASSNENLLLPFQYLRNSTAAPNGQTVFQPTFGAGVGRYHLLSLAFQSGTNITLITTNLTVFAGSNLTFYTTNLSFVSTNTTNFYITFIDATSTNIFYPTNLVFLSITNLVAGAQNYSELAALPTTIPFAFSAGGSRASDGGGGVFVRTNSITSTNLHTRIDSATAGISWDRIVPVWEWGQSNLNFGLTSGRLSDPSTTSNNLFAGWYAGQSNTIGYYAVLMGTRAGGSGTNLTAINIIGHLAGENLLDATTSTLYGYRNLHETTNAYDTVTSGYRAGHNTKLARGVNFEGAQAGYEMLLPEYTIGHGFYALRDATNGTYLHADGIEALRFAARNTNSLAVGYQAGRTDTNGIYNLWLGWQSGPSGVSTWTNAAGIGNFATAATNNFLMLGGPNQSVAIGTNWTGSKFDVFDSTTGNRTAMRLRRNTQAANATSGILLGDPYLNIGGLESRNTIVHGIGFGYNDDNNSPAPVELGSITDNSGFTKGRFYIATRDVTTSTVPTERLNVNAAGDVGIGTIAQNFGTYARAMTLSAGTSGNAYVGMELVGSRTVAEADFASLDFRHLGTNLSSYISGFRGSVVDSGGLHFGTKQSGAGSALAMTLHTNRDAQFHTRVLNQDGTAGTANQIFGLNAAATVNEYKTVTAGAGISIVDGVGSITINNTSPAAAVPGSDTQVIFNDGGVFGADAGFTFSKANDSITVVGGITNSPLTASALVASDANKALKSVAIGANLTYDGTTLSGTGGGSGSVTSVGLTMPTPFSVAGSPVTTSGTLAVTATDPGADRLLGWDDTGNALQYMIIGAGLVYDAATDTLSSTNVGVGGGDFVGPASATDNALLRFDGTTGKLGQNSSVILDDVGWMSGVTNLTVASRITNSILTASALVASDANKALKSVTIGANLTFDGTTLAAAGAGTGDFVGPSGASDNALVRFDLATGKLGQNSVAILTDAGALSGVSALTVSGGLTNQALTASKMVLTDENQRLISLPDPGFNAVIVWNDTANRITNATIGSGLSFNATSNTLTATNASSAIETMVITKTLVNLVNNSIFEVAIPNNSVGAVTIEWWLTATDTGEFTVGNGEEVRLMSNNAGSMGMNVGRQTSSGYHNNPGSTTMSSNLDMVAGAAKYTWMFEPISSMTTPTLTLKYRLVNPQAFTITPL